MRVNIKKTLVERIDEELRRVEDSGREVESIELDREESLLFIEETLGVPFSAHRELNYNGVRVHLNH